MVLSAFSTHRIVHILYTYRSKFICFNKHSFDARVTPNIFVTFVIVCDGIRGSVRRKRRDKVKRMMGWV